MKRVYITDFDAALLQPKALFPLVRPFLNKATGTWEINEQRLAEAGCSGLDTELVQSIEIADVVLVSEPLGDKPVNANYDVLNKVNDQCARRNVRAYAYISGDYGKVHPTFSNVTYFRMGGFKRQLDLNNEVMFPVVGDQLRRLFRRDEIVIRKKQAVPRVGFCGHASHSVFKLFYECAKLAHINAQRAAVGDFNFEPLFSSAFERSKLLRTVSESNDVETNFILRNKYRAGATTDAKRLETTLEYYNNIIDSDYVLCVRGSGNFSVRFYETLMMGRIPIFVNTDCLLPLQDEVEWKDHTVWVEWDDRRNIAKRITDFHNALSESSFIHLQLANRQLWRNKLTLPYFLRRCFEKSAAHTEPKAIPPIAWVTNA